MPATGTGPWTGRHHRGTGGDKAKAVTGRGRLLVMQNYKEQDWSHLAEQIVVAPSGTAALQRTVVWLDHIQPFWVIARGWELRELVLPANATWYADVEDDSKLRKISLSPGWKPVIGGPVQSVFRWGDRGVALALLHNQNARLEPVGGGGGPLLTVDRELMLVAIKHNRRALEHVGAALLADPEFVLAAVTFDAEALRHADPALKADREVVLAAVARNGMALAWAHRKFRADREIVVAAMTQCGDETPLQWASRALQTEWGW